MQQQFLRVQHRALALLRFEFGLGASQLSARSRQIGLAAGQLRSRRVQVILAACELRAKALFVRYRLLQFLPGRRLRRDQRFLPPPLRPVRSTSAFAASIPLCALPIDDFAASIPASAAAMSASAARMPSSA